MKYTQKSCHYIFKNFFYIFPFAILPALLLSLSTDEGAIQCVMRNFFTGKIADLHFEHLFCAISVLNFASVESVVFGLLGIVGIVVCVALLMAFLEKHMRIGKRTLNGIFSKLNDNFIPTARVTFTFLIVYEVWSLITSALLFLVTRWDLTAAAYVLFALVFVGMHVVLIYTISTVYLWLPCMQITGFRSFEALNYAYQLVAPVQWNILLGQLLFLFVTEALTCFCVAFVPEPFVFTLVTTVTFAVLIMVFCVRMQIAYFDRDHIERADLKRYGR